MFGCLEKMSYLCSGFLDEHGVNGCPLVLSTNPTDGQFFKKGSTISCVNK